MQVIQYLAVGFRLLAVVLFIYSLRQVATFITVAFTNAYVGLPASPAFFLVMAAIPLIAAAILWLFPATIAKKIVPPASDVAVVPEKTFSIFVALLLTVGVVLLFYASIDAIYWVTYTHLLSSSPEAYDRTSGIMQSNKANMLATFFEFFAALFIIFRAKYLANMLYSAAR